jgi:hypothetical protein
MEPLLSTLVSLLAAGGFLILGYKMGRGDRIGRAKGSVLVTPSRPSGTGKLVRTNPPKADVRLNEDVSALAGDAPLDTRYIDPGRFM